MLITLSVEGTWAIWNAWGPCAGTCNSDATWTRTRSSSGGNTPCSGSASETGSCTSMALQKDVSSRHEVTSYSSFQLRGHGQLGMPGALAQEHVIVMLLGLEQEASVEETHHAQEVQVKLAAVQVWHCKNMFNVYKSNLIHLFSRGDMGNLGCLGHMLRNM